MLIPPLSPLVGTDINRADAGNWLIIDNGVYLISAVKPQTDRTMLTLKSPLDAFARKFELAEQPTGQKIGTFIKAVLDAEFVGAADPRLQPELPRRHQYRTRLLSLLLSSITTVSIRLSTMSGLCARLTESPPSFRTRGALCSVR